MPPRTTLKVIVATALAGFYAFPSVARAAGDPAFAAATAQELFDEAKQLMAVARYPEACAKLEESQQIDPGLGTQFHLADCWLHVGRTASAWTAFREVEAGAHTLAEAGRERVAHDRAAAIEPLLSRLSISIHSAGGSPGLEIRQDGLLLGPDQCSVPNPVDPGMHSIRAIAPKKRAWSVDIDVPAQAAVVTVDVPPLDDESLSTSSVAAFAPPPPAASGPEARGTFEGRRGVTSSMPPDPVDGSVVQDGGGGQRAVGWFFVGSGAVALAAGAYFGARWVDDNGRGDVHCPRNACDATGADLRASAHTEGEVSAVTLASGGAAVLIGAIIVAATPAPRVVDRARAVNLHIRPTWSFERRGGGGLVVSGSW
jgi:hypothetical protein